MGCESDYDECGHREVEVGTGILRECPSPCEMGAVEVNSSEGGVCSRFPGNDDSMLVDPVSNNLDRRNTTV